jgi:hypothetical protein
MIEASVTGIRSSAPSGRSGPNQARRPALAECGAPAGKAPDGVHTVA